MINPTNTVDSFGIVKEKSKALNLNFLKRVKAKEKIFFIQNLKTMIKAGMSITEGLQTIIKQTDNQKFKDILIDLSNGVEAGKSLSESMGKYPKVFTTIFINMIAAGEMSGNLENILEQLYVQIKKDYDLISKIKGAMSYPVVVLTAMVGMLLGMVFFVFPTFIEIFEEANAELPFVTKILIDITGFIIDNGLITLIGAIIVIVVLANLMRTTQGKKLFHLFMLKAFIIGPLVKKINLARFARSLSSLLKTDIPIIKSFEITSSVVGNVHYKKAILESIDKIKKGSTIASAVQDYPKLFPPMIIQMIIVGEKSGTTDDLLNTIAEYYEEEVDNITKNLSSIIEPLLILVIGAAVGVIAVAVMMPMYNLSQSY